MPNALAARLLAPQHDRIAAAVGRQIRRTVPRYEQVDPIAIERNVKALITGIQRLLEKGDRATMLKIMEDIVQLRNLTGFQLSELLLAGLCFLPVLRRFLVTQASSVTEGLAAYEAVEAITLPFYGQLVELFGGASEEEVTAPRRPGPFGRDGQLKPMQIESVFDDDENTPSPF